MARTRLTDEERAARRKARNAHTFSDAAYKHYDPRKEGYGDADQWIKTAEALFGNYGSFRVRVDGNDAKLTADMELLGLWTATFDMKELKAAMARAARAVHPDINKETGSSIKLRKVLEAYQRLASQMG